MPGIIKKYKLLHVLAWTLLFLFWYYFRHDQYTGTGQALLVTALKVINIAFLVYITNYFLVPRLLYKRKYLLFVFVFLLMVIPVSLAKLALMDYIRNPEAPRAVFDDFKTKIYDNILPHIALVVAGMAVKLLGDYFSSQRRLIEMARQKAEAELNFLKSQINPHFLFNSLNAVYFLIDRQNTDARKALHTFSDMLRYQLYELNGARIAVEKEIGYLQDYVYLQKLRKDENYHVEMKCQPEVKGFSIEPLLLLPFVENAFKHISHFTGKMNYVKLSMTKTDGEFGFSVINTKEEGVKSTEEKGGIGLQNVKRRLELLYPGRYKLRIDDNRDTYAVDLTLKIDH